VLFRCEQISVRHYMDSTYGWENLVVGGIDVIDLPGDHVAIFEEPVVFTLAHELSARLQSVTSDQCSTWPTTSFHLPDKSCRLRQSTQHSSEVYARESGTGHTNFNPSDGRALRVRVPSAPRIGRFHITEAQILAIPGLRFTDPSVTQPLWASDCQKLSSALRLGPLPTSRSISRPETPRA
jgi:hypothetical protein